MDPERLRAERAAAAVKTESDAVFQVARHLLAGASFRSGTTWIRPSWDQRPTWLLGSGRSSVVFDCAYDAAITFVRMVGHEKAIPALLEAHLYEALRKA